MVDIGAFRMFKLGKVWVTGLGGSCEVRGWYG